MTKQLFLLALGALAFTGPRAAAPIVDRLGVGGPLTFNKTQFRLAWSAQPAATYYAQEYLPQGEKSSDFKQMLALHVSDQDADVQSAVNRKVTELEARKQTDPVCHYQVMSSPDNKEVILDFLLSQDMSAAAGVAEFNVYRYKAVTLGAGKRGVVVYAYSKRGYGPAIDGFLASLKTFRPVAIAEMAATKVPALTIKQAK